MKKLVSLCLAALLAFGTLTACGNDKETFVGGPSSGKPVAGKIVVNIEGTVAAVDGNEITLEDGKVVLVDENTAYTDANGPVEDAVLSEGDFIQGYTEDDPAAAEVTAKRIHIVVI